MTRRAIAPPSTMSGTSGRRATTARSRSSRSERGGSCAEDIVAKRAARTNASHSPGPGSQGANRDRPAPPNPRRSKSAVSGHGKRAPLRELGADARDFGLEHRHRVRTGDKAQRRLFASGEIDEDGGGLGLVACLLVIARAVIVGEPLGERVIIGDPIVAIAGRARIEEIGAEKARLDQRESDAEFGDFKRQRFREALDGEFARRVERSAWPAAQAADRSDVEDASGALLAHDRQNGARDIEHAK